MSLVENNQTKTELARPDDNAPLGVQLKYRSAQFAASLPAHMPVERFTRVVMTAVQMNPALWKADRRSFWNSCMIAAKDGLLPDGREGVMTVFNTNTKVVDEKGKTSWVSIPTVVWQVMVAGYRKKARNSGLIATWDVHAVNQRDHFEFELGDDPFIKHKPYLPKSLERQEGEDDESFAARWRAHCHPGPLIAVYSVCVLKSGEKSRDVMTRQEVEYIRDTYSKRDAKGNFSSAWVKSFGEMAKKTIAKRHSKVLPMSTDLDDLIRRDDELYDMAGASDRQINEKNRGNDAGARLDALLGAEDEAPQEDVRVDGGEDVEEISKIEPKPQADDPPVTTGKQDAETSASNAEAKAEVKPTEASQLSEQDRRIQAEVIETATARAEAGSTSLKHFLDDVATPYERKLIPPDVVLRLVKRAKEVVAAKGKA